MAANAYTIAKQVIQITFDGSTNDLDFTTAFPAGLRIQSVAFIASALTDVFVLSEESTSGQVIAKITGSGTVTFTPPINCRPFLDYSDCTLGTPANALAFIVYA